jgi:hypothetical protein
MITLPRHAQIWLPGYMRDRWRSRRRKPASRVWLVFADHFEPLWKGASEDTAVERVARWSREWPRIASQFHDSTGRPARYTFFYPEEEYRPHLLDPLQRLVELGIADVEVHLHHDGEGQQNFVDRISTFTGTLISRHGLLRKQNGRPAFAFIHGNWALDNSRPDGRCCGLNNELALLRDLGCYADLTMPSGASPTQSRTVNTIYWAVDDPLKPKSYDTGQPVKPGLTARGDLLMIPGPFGVRWSERSIPRMEGGELGCYDMPSRYRVRRWLDLAPRIDSDIFLKLYAHGAQERHSGPLLEGGLELALSLLLEECHRVGYQLHFSSPWEIYQRIEALQQERDPAAIAPQLESPATAGAPASRRG